MGRLLHSTGAVKAGGDDVLRSPTLYKIHVDGEIEIALSCVGDSLTEVESVGE